MLGWSIHVFPANTSGRYDSPDLVCSWQTGLGGTDWLDRMVEARRALMVHATGYPLASIKCSCKRRKSFRCRNCSSSLSPTKARR